VGPGYPDVGKARMPGVCGSGVGPAIQESIFYQGTLLQGGDIENLTPNWRAIGLTN